MGSNGIFMRVSDRILWTTSSLYKKEIGDTFFPKKGEIINILKNRYKIKLYDSFTIKNTNLETWVSSNEIEIDKEYYRDLKINELLG